MDSPIPLSSEVGTRQCLGSEARSAFGTFGSGRRPRGTALKCPHYPDSPQIGIDEHGVKLKKIPTEWGALKFPIPRFPTDRDSP